MDFENIQDTLASRAGWLVGVPGEVYEIPLSRSTSIFIMQNKKDRYDVVRMTWKRDERLPSYELYRAKSVNFQTALEIGHNYIMWLKDKNKRRSV